MTDPIMKQRALVAAWTENDVPNWSVEHRKTLIAMLDRRPTPSSTTESILSDIMKLLVAIKKKGWERSDQ
jgi:hypothetical protein